MAAHLMARGVLIVSKEQIGGSKDHRGGNPLQPAPGAVSPVASATQLEPSGQALAALSEKDRFLAEHGREAYRALRAAEPTEK